MLHKGSIVICNHRMIVANGFWLTYLKSYELVDDEYIRDNYYTIIDDRGMIRNYSKKFFITEAEHRTNIINEIIKS